MPHGGSPKRDRAVSDILERVREAYTAAQSRRRDGIYDYLVAVYAAGLELKEIFGGDHESAQAALTSRRVRQKAVFRMIIDRTCGSEEDVTLRQRSKWYRALKYFHDEGMSAETVRKKLGTAGRKAGSGKSAIRGGITMYANKFAEKQKERNGS